MGQEEVESTTSAEELGLLYLLYTFLKLTVMALILTRRPDVTQQRGHGRLTRSEVKFLDEIQTKVLRVFLLAIHSHLYSFPWDFYFF
jgi:hypothetical protein